MKGFHVGLAAIVFLLASAPVTGQTLKAVDAVEVVDAAGVRVGRLSGGRVLFEFDDQLFSVPVNRDGIVDSPQIVLFTAPNCNSAPFVFNSPSNASNFFQIPVTINGSLFLPDVNAGPQEIDVVSVFIGDLNTGLPPLTCKELPLGQTTSYCQEWCLGD